jgi:para-nitrobenzyl esterase
MRPALALPRPMSEDCLYLNIYTTSKTRNDKLPVMVWIPGGSGAAGAGSIYDGSNWPGGALW